MAVERAFLDAIFSHFYCLLQLDLFRKKMFFSTISALDAFGIGNLTCADWLRSSRAEIPTFGRRCIAEESGWQFIPGFDEALRERAQRNIARPGR